MKQFGNFGPYVESISYILRTEVCLSAVLKQKVNIGSILFGTTPGNHKNFSQ